MQTKINNKIFNLTREVETLQIKVNLDFINNFEWGNVNNLYCLKYEIELLKNIGADCVKNDEQEILTYYINKLTNELIEGKFVSNARNKEANDSLLLRRETECKVLKFLKQL
jgi:hypothetical protein